MPARAFHSGYGFPVGTVAATTLPDGVVSPGGVGYDINCGVRLLVLPLTAAELGDRKGAPVHEISRRVPTGTGRSGGLTLADEELDGVLRSGPAATSWRCSASRASSTKRRRGRSTSSPIA